MKKKAVLFGASKLAQRSLEYIQSKYDVMFFTDNDSNKWGKELNGIYIIPPNKIKELKYDCVIITSSFYEEISLQLLKMDILSFYKVVFYVNSGKVNYSIVDVNLDEKYDMNIYRNLYGRNLGKKKFYNIGAGTFYHPFWTNIDFKSEWYSKNKVDINFDLMSNKPLPLEGDNAEVIYTSHVIEHIPNESVQNMFNEVYRVLKPGGIFRITCPNIDLDYRAYLNNDIYFYYWRNMYSSSEDMKRVNLSRPMNSVSISQLFLYHFAAQVSILHENTIVEKVLDDELYQLFNSIGYEATLDYCCSKCRIDIQKENPGNHINWWNPKKVKSFLEQAGFKHIYISQYGQSMSPLMRNVQLFDNTHPKLSMYIEAVK